MVVKFVVIHVHTGVHAQLVPEYTRSRRCMYVRALYTRYPNTVIKSELSYLADTALLRTLCYYEPAEAEVKVDCKGYGK